MNIRNENKKQQLLASSERADKKASETNQKDSLFSTI